MDGYGRLVCMDGHDATRSLSLELRIRITVRRSPPENKRLTVQYQRRFWKHGAKPTLRYHPPTRTRSEVLSKLSGRALRGPERAVGWRFHLVSPQLIANDNWPLSRFPRDVGGALQEFDCHRGVIFAQ